MSPVCQLAVKRMQHFRQTDSGAQTNISRNIFLFLGTNLGTKTVSGSLGSMRYQEAIEGPAPPPICLDNDENDMGWQTGRHNNAIPGNCEDVPGKVINHHKQQDATRTNCKPRNAWQGYVNKEDWYQMWKSECGIPNCDVIGDLDNTI